MNRRTFVLGLSSLAGTVSAILGAGAFTSVHAKRGLEVETAGDNDAFLALTQLGDGGRSIEDGTPEKVEFRFPSLEERMSDLALGLGVNSVYEFERDANESSRSDPIEGLLRIENQGTQTVNVYSKHESDSELEIEIYDVTDSAKTALRDDPAKLAVGESIDIGFRIRTFGSKVTTFNETLTIVADTTA